MCIRELQLQQLCWLQLFSLISLVESSMTLDIFGIDGLCSNKDLIDEGFVLPSSQNLFKSCQLYLFKLIFNLYPRLYYMLPCQTLIISSPGL